MARSRPPEQLSWVVERELIHSVGWLFQVRWVVGAVVLVLPWPASRLPGLHLEALPLSLCGLLLLAANLLLLLFRRGLRERANRLASSQEERLARRVRRAGLMLGLQMALDWGATFAILHWTGGVQSPLLFLPLVHLVLASKLLRASECLLLAGVAVLLAAGLALAHLRAWLPERPLTAAYPPLTLENAALQVGGFALIAFSIAWLSTSLAARFRHREKVILALGENLELAFGRLQSLYGLARVTTSILEPKELLARMAERLALSVGARACLVHLTDPKTGEATLGANFGLEADPPAPPGPGESALLDRLLAGRSLSIANLKAESDPWAVRLAGLGQASLAAAPARGKKGVTGWILALSPEPSRLGPEEASFLEAAGFHAGLAIENALAWTTLGELEKAKAAFVQIVTHELRSPVGVILSLLKTVASGFVGKLEARQVDLLQRAQSRTHLLLELVGDLLALAASRSLPGCRPDLAPMDLVEAADRVVERHQVPAREKGLELSLDKLAAKLEIVAAPDAIDRILDNLVANAVKYTPRGGRIAVELWREEGAVFRPHPWLRTYRDGAQVGSEEEVGVFQVTDTGIGIPGPALERLGQEFFRAPNARSLEPAGTGLGLAITKDLIRSFRGTLAIQSTEGQGSRFTVRFPLRGRPPA